MNLIRNNNTISLIFLVLMSIPTLNNAMHAKKPVEQLSVIKSFLSNSQTIETIKKVMDDIEEKKLGYDDYSNRTGLVWSDHAVKTSNPAELIHEFQTRKATRVFKELRTNNPQSLLSYPALHEIVSNEILPKLFKAVEIWTELPGTVFAQIFFQRCSTSEPMDWHQDPGEDYDPQADYSLVLMLSDQDDPQYGWSGGEFKIRSGLPEEKFDETTVETIIPRYNQAVIFNNQINSHATTEVVPKGQLAKRDIIVIPFNMTTLPVKKNDHYDL